MVTDWIRIRNMNIERSIIIPAYAEAGFIAGTLQQLHDYLRQIGWLDTTEVVVVTADAKDETIAITASKIRIFPHHQHVQPGPRVGKGRDVKAGLSVAKGKLTLFMDADMATPVVHIKEAFDVLQKNGGMVIGVRHLHEMHKTLSRRITSRLSNTIIRAMIGWNITDSQCGFKGFDHDTLVTILERSTVTGWGFDFEFIKIAKLHKKPITALDVPDWHDPKPEGTGLAGDSQLDAMKQTLSELLQVKKKQLNGDYK